MDNYTGIGMIWKDNRSKMNAEQYFKSIYPNPVIDREHEKIPVIVTENYTRMGQLTALRFLEWVNDNPEGVIALPTGKTPEYFIKWTQYYLANWSREQSSGILAKIGFKKSNAPSLKGLRFVQLDEFFPINPRHERSFSWFVRKFYIDGFGLDDKKALLIDTYNINNRWKSLLPATENMEQIFPEGKIDLRLRTRQVTSITEKMQYNAIKLFDQFCEDYENKIREMDGIGFFLGGIGPDGHIAFNVKGSSHHSHTRLTGINYETMAAAAQDLGGIEAVRKKAVVTIGLETITFNKNVTAIITAAGQAKANIVAKSITGSNSLDYPASCLHGLKNARMYLTQGSASTLEYRTKQLLKQSKTLDNNTVERLVLDGAVKSSRYLTTAEFSDDNKVTVEEWELAADKTGKSKKQLISSTRETLVQKISKGLRLSENQRYLHTAPHHDDIELAYFPLLHHLVRSASNDNHFCYCTSGFTSVTNEYIETRLRSLLDLISRGILFNFISLKNLSKPDKAQDDIHGFLRGIAAQSKDIQDLHVAARLYRLIAANTKNSSPESLCEYVNKQLHTISKLSPGEVDPESIRDIKSWLREWEAELVWSHFGIGMDKVSHLRLKFYTGDIFPEDPEKEDVDKILELLEKVEPTVVTLALDPEGSGPDTHYKTLIALAKALEIYTSSRPDLNIHIWGYRNVWSRFHPAEVNTIIPVSLNSFAVLHSMFNSCFTSQRSASFPSYELDGPFSELAQKVWVEQFDTLTSLLGKSYFYKSPNPMMRRAYGAIYIKDMDYGEFKEEIKNMTALLNAKIGLGTLG